MPSAQNRENIRMDMSFVEATILQKLMLEIQGQKGWWQRLAQEKDLVTNLVLSLPQYSERHHRVSDHVASKAKKRP